MSNIKDDNLTAESKKSQENIKDNELPKEYGGRKKGLEPTRYGDWEKEGRCVDF